jgi:hypothetical protein
MERYTRPRPEAKRERNKAPAPHLDHSDERYPSFDEAVHMVAIVGIRNVYAAYFLGQMELIGDAISRPTS